MIDLDRIDAVIFDMDGVVTDTASVHARAWKRLFDEFLEARAGDGESFRPFDDGDYRRYVDGKPRYDGVRSFLGSRGIEVPEGDPADPPDRETVYGLGNRKDGYFLGLLREHGAQAYDSTVAVVERLQREGVATAIISASRNMRQVLDSAGLSDLFEAKVDGVDADELGLPGKPDPAVFLEAARRLDVKPDRTVIVEDALAGVEAGRRGGFMLVVGVDRTGHPDELAAGGADVVVPDLAELRLDGADERHIPRLPSPLDRITEIRELLTDREPAIFLDYDGTLTPIVEDPAKALLPEATRDAIRDLARRCTVAIISGRDLADVRAMVDIEGIVYAGSHGFDIVMADGQAEQHGREFLPALDRAEEDLREPLARIPGARLERKGFAIAVHFRQVADEHVGDIERAVDDVASKTSELRKTGGKKIFELRPALDWDKGKALLRLLEALGLDRPDVVSLYIGDDETDEDAFRALDDRGFGIVVGTDDRPTAARYALTDPDEARAFIQALTAIVGRNDP